MTSPNNLINSHGSVATYDRPNTFKATGTYDLPHGFILSGNFHAQSGLPIARTETFKLNQGNVTINATTPGSARLDPLVGIDARVGKEFKFRERYTLEATVDCFNLLNANTVSWECTNSHRTPQRECGRSFDRANRSANKSTWRRFQSSLRDWCGRASLSDS